MFRIVCDPSSGSTVLCLTEITLSGSHIFFVCLVGVWQRNFEPAVCVYGTCTHTAGSKLRFQCLDHPPYSPDLAPSGYHLFPGLNKTIESSPFFARRGGHCCRGDLVVRTIF